MSIHSSLRFQGALSRARNVFKRTERLQILKENERWSEEQSVFGLPKVRTRFKAIGVKKKEKKEGETPAAETTGGTGTAGGKAKS